VYEKVKYEDLNSKQKEIYNFQKASAILAEYGFNCIKLADDWRDADFIAYHHDKVQTLRVQQKSRATIDGKYMEKDLYMLFPIKGVWYLIEHDRLIEIVRGSTPWLDSPTWKNKRHYNSDKPSKALVQELQPFALAA